MMAKVRRRAISWAVVTSEVGQQTGRGRRGEAFFAPGRPAVLPVLEAADELQAGPRLVYGADLDVHQAGGEADAADVGLGDVGRDTGGLLRPGDPQRARGRELGGQPGEILLEGLGGRDKQLDQDRKSTRL